MARDCRLLLILLAADDACRGVGTGGSRPCRAGRYIGGTVSGQKIACRPNADGADDTSGVDATEHVATTDVASSVLGILDRYKRVAPAGRDDEEHPPDHASPNRLQHARIHHFVGRGEPIHFVIPAFPAKSPNRSKVLGALPDLGERVALEFLQSLCDYVGHVYSGGARITICSDGHVFGDVVGVSDEAATAYREQITRIVDAENGGSVDMYGLDDAFGSLDYPALRAVLERQYATPMDELRASVRTDRTMAVMFNGMHRFLFEDALGVRGRSTSKSALRRESKEAAYQTIRRSNAWSRVVAERFPDAVRLSIHPQPPDSEKFGLSLMRAGDNWLTPWHGVVLDDGRRLTLVKRWEAERAEATLVWRDGRPSHFVAPHLGSMTGEVEPA